MRYFSVSSLSVRAVGVSLCTTLASTVGGIERGYTTRQSDEPRTDIVGHSVELEVAAGSLLEVNLRI